MSLFTPSVATVIARANALLNPWSYDGSLVYCGSLPVLYGLAGVTPRTLERIVNLMGKAALIIAMIQPKAKGDWDYVDDQLRYQRLPIAGITSIAELGVTDKLTHAHALEAIVNVLNAVYTKYPEDSLTSRSAWPGTVEYGPGVVEAFNAQSKPIPSTHRQEMMAAHDKQLLAAGSALVLSPHPTDTESLTSAPDSTGFQAINELIRGGTSRDILVVAGGMSKEPKTVIKSTPRAIDIGITTVNRSPMPAMDELTAPVFDISMLATPRVAVALYKRTVMPKKFQINADPLRVALAKGIMECLSEVVPVDIYYTPSGFGISLVASESGVGELFKFYAVLRDYLAKGVYLEWIKPESGGHLRQSGQLYDTALSLRFTPQFIYDERAKLDGYRIDLDLAVCSESQLALMIGLGLYELREYKTLADQAAKIGLLTVHPILPPTPDTVDDDDFNPGYCDIGSATIQIGDDD